MQDGNVHRYTHLQRVDILQLLRDIDIRSCPENGKRQVPFNAVETLLCFGLFWIVNPHSFGGANIDKVPDDVKTLAKFFKRSPGSLLSKMLNLEGARKNGGREEPLLYAQLSADPSIFHVLYSEIIQAARDLDITVTKLPDFLRPYAEATNSEDYLLGQDDLPASQSALLKDVESSMEEIDRDFKLGSLLTEKLAERKVRLSQHRFALAVMNNYQRTCVFCGLAPDLIPGTSGLLRASHIKPWAASTTQERMDVRNGLAACAMHDLAFDQGYLSVDNTYTILRARLLQQSIGKNSGMDIYFNHMLSTSLLRPNEAKNPDPAYLSYHRERIFKG
ncbi:HNH endonuclease [Dictyobacter arantiisoli]|uniref:Restriction endonuclease n=1 Tax=Dictyobacter arantiisoli TaxID=2014874 RepID=A0A5A5TCN7_9CHLR|nr:HNH endonuclease [Dictyobacter arantiisoli]GCF08793.1 restriction endonuclease [Dictyobacter arantiisoli]